LGWPWDNAPLTKKTPFPASSNILSILVPPHVSLQPEVPANDSWKEIVNQSISHHRGWPTMSLPLPPPINPNVQIACVVLPVQSSHASKRLKTDIPQPMQDKGKSTTSPSSPSTDSSKYVSSHLHLKDDCSHVINEIQPQGSNQPQATSENSKGNNSVKRKIASQSGK
jgi:hypothetical protein